jgi:hypothetical protein
MCKTDDEDDDNVDDIWFVFSSSEKNRDLSHVGPA